MIKLLNLTIKIDDKDKYDRVFPGVVYSLTRPRFIEIAGLEIKDQNGVIISELKNSGGGLGTSKIPVNSIKNIRLTPSVFDIPISWAWEKRGGAGEIEFTLKNLKYNETKGLSFDSVSSTTAGAAVNTLSLTQNNFEGFEVFKSKTGNKFYVSQIIELSNNFSNDVKQTLRDFLDLKWKITKAEEDEQITRFISEIESWQNATAPSLKHDFYQLKNINGDWEEVKTTCQEILKEIRDDLNEWKKVGIKTLVGANIAKENGFDIIANPFLKSQISPTGQYKGFFIANEEKHDEIIERVIDLFSGSEKKEKATKNRYTKENIDNFRQYFTKDLDQSDPKYFRGFQPGDIKKNTAGDFVSINHRSDIRDQTNSEWKFERSDYTRVYYELKSYYDGSGGTKPYDILLSFLKNKFAEMPNKTKKEHLDTYWRWVRMNWPEAAEEDKVLKGYYRSLTDLLPILETSYVNETKDRCETANNILKNYENLKFNPFSGKYQVWVNLSSEIKDKKAEITDRLKVLFDQVIDAALNEDYGSGQLSSERKRIFTTYRNQIDTFTLIEEIKKLIKLLVEGEKIISEPNLLVKMASASKLKEYQNGLGDKKTAYTIVNQVGNQWVDRTITELGNFTQKDSATLLAERRTQLQAKYDNSAKAQAIFSNNILDSVAALDTAEKLLIKVEEAQDQSDTNASLLKFLQNYQKAKEGTVKNKAWRAVNSYNSQAEAAIKHLQKNDQSREEIVKAILNAKNESELEVAYTEAQNSELYQQGGKSETVIDNLIQRKKVLFQIEQNADISVENKTLFQVILVKVIPDTVKDDDDEQELTWLESRLKTFSEASESEEKGKIYQEYKEVIDQVLTEINQEKQRYQQTKLQDNEEQVDIKKPKSPSGLPKWAWLLIITGVIAAVGGIILVIGRKLRKSSKKSLKL